MNTGTILLFKHCKNNTLTKTLLEQLLEHNNADINFTQNNTCPLWITIINKNWNIAWMLIQYGASTNTEIFGQSIFLKSIQIAPPFFIEVIISYPNTNFNAKDKLGYGCIHYACERNDPTILQILLTHCQVSLLDTSNTGDAPIDMLKPTTDPLIVQRISIYTLIATTQPARLSNAIHQEGVQI
tara:strand:- start:1166 stop:1717 length:552 start_codon:yes stop_codon:yes gene_type:complete